MWDLRHITDHTFHYAAPITDYYGIYNIEILSMSVVIYVKSVYIPSLPLDRRE